MAAAVPWIVMGGSSIVSAWLGSRKSKQEKSAQSAQAASLTQLARQGQQNFNAGFPAMNSALNYYQTLLSGNRAAQSQALAAPMAGITDTFRGAEQGLERQGVRGGVKDMAVADLQRDKANQIGQLTAGVQPMAAANLGQLGSAATGMASGPLSASAIGFGNMAGAATQDRMYRNSLYQNSANNIGEMAFGIWKQKQAGKGGGQTPPVGV
jgi:hypothetical protein